MNNGRKFNYWIMFLVSGVIACCSASVFLKVQYPSWLTAAGIFFLIFQQAYIKLGEEK